MVKLRETIKKRLGRKKGGLLSKSFVGALLVVTVILSGCAQEVKETKKEQAEKTEKKLSGEVKVDGSSTVGPITEAVAEEFQKENPDVRVTVGISGTGAGFKKFANGEIDINNASRPIKDEEKEACQKNNIRYLELKVGFDGITVVVNKENDWCTNLTVEELKKIWEPGSKVQKWSDIRPEWPKEKIVLFGPDTDSGTFDYFTDEIVGEEGKSRSDYTPSADDNVLVEGVVGEKYALGYFGFAYYEQNQDKLKAVKVNGVSPSTDSIRDGSYSPLSRTLYIYINNDSLKREEIFSFLKFYMENATTLVAEVGYVPLTADVYAEQLSKLENVK